MTNTHPKLTEQECFTKVKNHLLKQNRQATYTNAMHDIVCMYRGEDKTACAIGCLIPTGMYRKDMEGTSAGRLGRIYPNLPFSGLNEDWLNRLQEIHDDYPQEDWPTFLKGFADNYELEYDL